MQQDTNYQRYEKLDIIGKGNFGSVYKGIDLQTKEYVAIKVIDLDEAEDVRYIKFL